MSPEDGTPQSVLQRRAAWAWREDREKAARELLSIVNDRSAFERGEDGGVHRRWEPAGFVTALLQCMLRADRENLALLAIGFPAHAWAVVRYQEPGGLAGLRERAGWATGGLDD